MEEASLDFSPAYGFEAYGHFLCDLVQNLFTVRVLTVCSYFLQVIPTGEDELRMRSDMNLEHFTIELGGKPLFDINFKRFWIDNSRLYQCMRSTLKEVEIKNFRGTWNEIHMLSYFIIGGKVLNKVVINILKEDVAG
ncbi:FBD domain [Sesbania bispinosa]|nr:FBD domain [Sesbania bispinosa]